MINRRSHLNGDLNVTVNNQQLTWGTNSRYLGVEVDKTLGWQSQVDTICKKVFPGIGALKMYLLPGASPNPNENVWGFSHSLFWLLLRSLGMYGKGLCDRLQRLQNRAGRIITFSDYNTRSVDILQELGWDTLDQRHSKQLAISAFKYLNNLYPESWKTCSWPGFIPTTYEVPRTEAAKPAFSYRGAVVEWPRKWA